MIRGGGGKWLGKDIQQNRLLVICVKQRYYRLKEVRFLRSSMSNKMKCFYCEKNEALNKQVTNPLTKEIHPTCPVCEYGFTLVGEDIKNHGVLGAAKNCEKRDQLEAQYAKEHGLYSAKSNLENPKFIKWCKNCVHFKKQKGWEDKFLEWDDEDVGEIIPEDSMLPCKIVSETKITWDDYFSVHKDERAYYPKNCFLFSPK
jgi:hypothetical protein